MHSLANSHGKIVLMLDMQHSIWVTSSALVSSSWFWAEYSAEESSSLSWILVSGLDVSSNPISSLSQTIQQYLALSKWTMCELDSFPIFLRERSFESRQKILGLMVLMARLINGWLFCSIKSLQLLFIQIEKAVLWTQRLLTRKILLQNQSFFMPNETKSKCLPKFYVSSK